MKATNSAEKRGTILVIDDDPAILTLIEAILTAADYRVVAAGSGGDAVHLATQRHVRLDVVLLDVHMPGPPASVLAREMTLLRPNLPIVFMSGLVDDEVIRIRLLDKYAGFVLKPVTGHCLLQTVRQAMEVSQVPAPASAQMSPAP